jgi:uncharacterized protein with HEPN domain
MQRDPRAYLSDILKAASAIEGRPAGGDHPTRQSHR